ncbi:MAG TPA: bL28 family ribosomal protein [Patescibacteria group bacterium]|nr:bL28 family ribosomal protein [Patescibacteria group bacterium]
MSNICDKCGKGRMTGHNVSHAKNRTAKSSSPNLHRSSPGRGQISQRLCSRCLRSLAGLPN